MWGTQTKEEEGRARSQGKTAHYIHLPRPPPRGGQISAIMLCADLLGPVGMRGEMETTTFRLGGSNCDGRGRIDRAMGESGIGKTQRAMGPGGRNELSLKGKVERPRERGKEFCYLVNTVVARDIRVTLDPTDLDRLGRFGAGEGAGEPRLSVQHLTEVACWI